MKYTVKMPGFNGKQETIEFSNYIFFANWFRTLNANNGNRYDYTYESPYVIKIRVKRM